MIGQGQASKLEGQIKSIRYQTQAEAGRVRAVQADAEYREKFNSVLSSIHAIGAGQGVGVDSPTQLALADRAEDTATRSRITAASNERIKAMGYEADSDAARRAGNSAMSAAYLKALPSAIDGAQKLYSWGSSW